MVILIYLKIGVNFSSKEMKLFSENDKDDVTHDLNMCIWDCSGEEWESKFLPQNVYKNANGFLICCSYDNLSSLANVKQWIAHIKQNSSLKNSCILNSVQAKKCDIPIFILFNKYDIPEKEKAFSKQEIETHLKELVLVTEADLNIKIYDKVSAKSDTNIEYVFDRIIQMMTNLQTQTYQSYLFYASQSLQSGHATASNTNSIEFELDPANFYKRTFILTLDKKSKQRVPIGNMNVNFKNVKEEPSTKKKGCC
jgi:GTPase SAR1 family protein